MPTDIEINDKVLVHDVKIANLENDMKEVKGEIKNLNDVWRTIDSLTTNLNALSEAAQLSKSGYSLFYLIEHIVHLIYGVELAEAETDCAFNFLVIKPHSGQHMTLTFFIGRACGAC